MFLVKVFQLLLILSIIDSREGFMNSELLKSVAASGFKEMSPKFRAEMDWRNDVCINPYPKDSHDWVEYEITKDRLELNNEYL